MKDNFLFTIIGIEIANSLIEAIAKNIDEDDYQEIIEQWFGEIESGERK